MKELYQTNYAVAVSWLDTALILCNNIPEIDPSVWDNFEPLVDISRDDDDEEETPEVCDECGGEMIQNGPNMMCSGCGNYNEGEDEIYQWYLTDCSQSDVEYLMRTFSGMVFTYSDLLDVYVLCVTHYGTGWSYVSCQTTNKYAARKEGEKK